MVCYVIKLSLKILLFVLLSIFSGFLLFILKKYLCVKIKLAIEVTQIGMGWNVYNTDLWQMWNNGQTKMLVQEHFQNTIRDNLS